MKLKVINESSNPSPKFETAGSAGADIRANIEILIKPGKTELIPTGLFIEIPQGYEIQIRPRSGLSYKTKLRVANAPGTIDSDYRGEIKVLMDNIGNEDIVINFGDRIAQMVLSPVIQFELIESDKLSETDRGTGGFGSTGNK